MNDDAGRGGLLLVHLRMADGQELPMVVDTGTSGTVIDKSWESKLGKTLGEAVSQSWGVSFTNRVYAAPKLYLGNAPLQAGDRIVVHDFYQLSDGTGHPVLGILGMDVLEHYCIQFDFAARKIRFLDDDAVDKQTWGKAFPIVPLNSKDGRPAVAENLLGTHGPHSLIDSGCSYGGWLMPQYFKQWTNHETPATKGEARQPGGLFDGEPYPFIGLEEKAVESDGIGLRFLARHLVTLDFPRHTMYLKRQSFGPLQEVLLKATRIEVLDPLILAVLREDEVAAQAELVKIDQGSASGLIKVVAQSLTATLDKRQKPTPAEVSREVIKLPLGNARPEQAEAGWLIPTANRIPLNDQIESPLLDSGKIYATGLFAHAPSRYVYDLGGKWNMLSGEAGLHTAFQPYAAGVVFVIKTDGKEVFRSAIIRGTEHAIYNVKVAGTKTLEMIVERGAERNGGNWALWLDPILSR